MKFFKVHIISLYALLIIAFSACNSSSYKISNSEVNYILIDSLVGYDQGLEDEIKPYRDSLKAEMLKVIGTAAEELTGGLPESLLSNFVCDLVLEESRSLKATVNPDVSIVNVKGLRIPISKGPITVESVFQLMPFENELVYLTLSKQQITELFNFMASVGGDGIAGASFGIKNKQAVDVKVNGKALEDREYVVVTSDYLADGGDHFTVFQSAIAREGSGLKVRDAIVQHIQKQTSANKNIESQLDRRIYHAD
ncbi:5'-nucleotidase C-terminal domain-containing protein [Carboxylicivirga sp. M1479]|uniref:5'-nucleotidase C-terminal domain-containing protein n=1 Tax=Carboxylicivirga sp. M1479 TaxID=2594476 RepID=UPI00117870B5|nr:5'-nucleotidase [Carboxylicivirga sp. M1479]TRX63190.1 hypothetical protein FNN09_19040 [Carboxylicivirga sp. M1479]